jgi:small subunit ribosomal protein S4
LREKQKVKRMYGLVEKQFHKYFVKAESKKGVTGVNLLQFLEMRFDNIVYRLGFANSRNQSRQFVKHGHFLVNGKKVDIPSLMLREGDVVEVTEKGQKMLAIQEARDVADRRGLPDWLEIESENFKGTVKAVPQREDISFPVNEHLIVELYSK